MAEGGRGIQSVEVSGRILRSLVLLGRPVMLKDLADLADIKPAQCHAYLISLKNIGLVHQDRATGYYAVGPLALRLGVSWIKANTAMSEAINVFAELADEYGVMSLITVWGQFGPTIVDIHAGSTQASLNLHLGSVFSVTGTATGRLFAAFKHDAEVDALIDAELSNSAKSPSLGEEMTVSQFQRYVGEIKSTRLSVTFGRPIPGVNAIAAPVFSKGEQLQFVATLLGRSDCLDVALTSEPVRKACEQAERISSTLTAPAEPVVA